VSKLLVVSDMLPYLMANTGISKLLSILPSSPFLPVFAAPVVEAVSDLLNPFLAMSPIPVTPHISCTFVSISCSSLW